ncbi:MAG: protease modulator HflC [Clostridiaceae bacterium]|jgi:membrane protease subunit HflC|nr:protease modulator HflC [Clostridiaceae bacterium]
MNASNNLDHKNKNVFLDLLMKKLLMIFLFILFIAIVVSNVLVVKEDELVVIKQFGNIERIIDKPGLYFKIPFIQNTDSLTKKLSNYEVHPITVFSKDKKDVIAISYAIWKITEPHSFINNIANVESAEALIENEVHSALRQKFSELSYVEIIRGTASGKDYNEDITAEVKKQLQNTGIDILDVRLMRIELTADEEETVYAAMKSEREKVAKQYNTMAENEASQIEAEADMQAEIIISKANSTAEEVKGKADAEAAKIYAESYNKDPEFYKFIRTLESYKKTLSDKTTIILPIDSPYAKYLLGK